MPTTNDITGDAIKSKPPTDRFREEFERIFGKPKGEDFYCSTHDRFTSYRDAKGSPCCHPSLPGVAMRCMIVECGSGEKK